MLLPSLTKARQKAKQISCVSKLKQTNLYAKIYADDNDEFLIIYGSPSLILEEDASFRGRLLDGGYIPDEIILQCPNLTVTDVNKRRYNTYCNYFASAFPAYYNKYLPIHGDFAASGRYANKGTECVCYKKIKSPAKLYMMMDTIRPAESDWPTPVMVAAYHPRIMVDSNRGGSATVHGERGNISFADGHVESWSAKDMYTNDWTRVLNAQGVVLAH